MGLVRKEGGQRPQISSVKPASAIAGGEFVVQGARFRANGEERPRVRFGEVEAPLVVGADDFMVVRVPEGATVGELIIENRDASSSPYACNLGFPIAENLHPVANPVVDMHGNIYTTFSGSRGQKVPVSVYKIDPNYEMKPFVKDLMNATGLALDREGMLLVSSRFDGTIYQVAPSGKMSIYSEGMGIATGLALDEEGNLYVGDRSGTIFKIAPSLAPARQIFVFATLEPSISAYHLAVAPDQSLFVTGPTTSSFDSIYRISHNGEVEVYYRGLGRPQGMAFDAEGRLYVAASLGGRKGIWRFGPERKPELVLSGPGIVGLAFASAHTAIVATNNALYRVDLAP
ncbi:MAG TPA: IPT/TIG domain-containing protein [Bryobacterales bacterium]|jgi:sugar lactone lactonase YvrE|nr:IPT/TIG domain-containing protein [Bryobacterales bacterium]